MSEKIISVVLVVYIVIGLLWPSEHGDCIVSGWGLTGAEVECHDE